MRWIVAALVAVLGLSAAGVLSIKARAKEQIALSAETARLAVTTVSVAYPRPEPRSNELELPGSVQAYTESPIYARTNGYLLHWYKDIGATVQKGD
jgi:multidrug efflux pump subunit AcrA (membrane-fusion protein)